MGRNSSEAAHEYFDSSAAFRAALSAPLGHEPVTRGDVEATERTNQDIRRATAGDTLALAAGRIVGKEGVPSRVTSW
jgi:hypothetical protein